MARSVLHRAEFVRLFCEPPVAAATAGRDGWRADSAPPAIAASLARSLQRVHLAPHGLAFPGAHASPTRWFIDIVVSRTAFGITDQCASPEQLSPAEALAFLKMLHQRVREVTELQLTPAQVRVHMRVAFGDAPSHHQHGHEHEHEHGLAARPAEFIPLSEITPHLHAACYHAAVNRASGRFSDTHQPPAHSLRPASCGVGISSDAAVLTTDSPFFSRRAMSAISFHEHELLTKSEFRFVNLHLIKESAHDVVYWAWDLSRAQAVVLKMFALRPDFDLRYRMAYRQQCVSNPALKRLRGALYPNNPDTSSVVAGDARRVDGADGADGAADAPSAPLVHPGAFMPAAMLCEISTLRRLQGHRNIVRLLAVESGERLCRPSVDPFSPSMSPHAVQRLQRHTPLASASASASIPPSVGGAIPALCGHRGSAPSGGSAELQRPPPPAANTEVASSVVVLDFVPFTLTSFSAQYSDRVLPLATVRSLFRQVMSAVEHVHFHRMVLNNLNPGRVLVSEVGRVFLNDFDLRVPTRLLPEAGDGGCDARLPCYLAPELLPDDGAPRVPTVAVDIWSCACLLAEMVLGRPLFHAAAPHGPDADEGDVQDEPERSSPSQLAPAWAADAHRRVRELAARQRVTLQHERFLHVLSLLLPRPDDARDTSEGDSEPGEGCAVVACDDGDEAGDGAPNTATPPLGGGESDVDCEMAATWRLLESRLGGEGLNLFVHMLQLDPEHRMTADVVLQHRFLLEDDTS